MSESLRYEELAEALARLGYSQHPAEYHGALCGALCVRAAEEIDPLRLLDPEARPGGTDHDRQALQRLRGESVEAFTGSELSFSPLLPDDEAGLPARVRALSAWCEGFLYGLTSGRPLNMKECSAELKEILRDFTEFTHAGVEDDENLEVEENAYAELVEYIRVGAQLIYLELHPPRASEWRAPPVH